jgi:hypothetical protein
MSADRPQTARVRRHGLRDGHIGRIEIDSTKLKMRQKTGFLNECVLWKVVVVVVVAVHPLVPIEHTAFAKHLHLALRPANLLNSLHVLVLPHYPASSKMVLFQVCSDRPLLAPCGFQCNALFSMDLSSLLFV